MAHSRHPAGVIAANNESNLLASLNWDAPWLAPLRVVGESVAQQVQAGALQRDALNMQATASMPASIRPVIQFVSQSSLSTGVAYEQHIFDTATVPTREGLHDLLNGIIWLHFPRTKIRLNQLHVAHSAKSCNSTFRGPARDALTLFDENGALMRTPDVLWEALVTKDWHKAFGELRGLWSESYVVLFGHALLEKLVFPRKSITAHVYRTHPVSDSVADLDAWMATDLSAEKLATKPFAHLPVLGVPAWWPANERLDFYADPAVFRAPSEVARSVHADPRAWQTPTVLDQVVNR